MVRIYLALTQEARVQFPVWEAAVILVLYSIFVVLAAAIRPSILSVADIKITSRKKFPDRDSMKKSYVYKGSHLPTYHRALSYKLDR